jgi:hypothetical protein
MGGYRDWYLMRELAAGVHSIQAEVNEFSKSNGHLRILQRVVFRRNTLPFAEEELISLASTPLVLLSGELPSY